LSSNPADDGRIFGAQTEDRWLQATFPKKTQGSSLTDLGTIALVLDRSASMAKLAKQAIDGFNSVLESNQKAPGDAKLTLVLFDHEYIAAHDGRPIQEVQKLDEHSYQPRGRTALHDAIGRMIKTVGELHLSARRTDTVAIHDQSSD
jgi:uncharacterized protein YegL